MMLLGVSYLAFYMLVFLKSAQPGGSTGDKCPDVECTFVLRTSSLQGFRPGTRQEWVRAAPAAGLKGTVANGPGTPLVHLINIQ